MIREKRREYSRFRDYLHRQFLVDNPAEITPDHIHTFLVHMRDKVRVGELNPHRLPEKKLLSPHTVQGYFRAVRAFFTWLTNEEYTEKDPCTRIRRPKAPQNVVPTLRLPNGSGNRPSSMPIMTIATTRSWIRSMTSSSAGAPAG